jgi:hypothetical protein
MRSNIYATPKEILNKIASMFLIFIFGILYARIISNFGEIL